jgi:AraC family transcriptional activator of mtrCDE
MTPSHDYYFTLILYAKNQKMIDDPSMPQHDWLSKFLKMITVTGQLEVRCSYGSPWNVTWQQASVYEIPYHVVLSGRAMIEDTESGATFEVGSGDIVLFPYGSSHTLHDGSGQTPAAKRIRKMQGGWTYNENDGEGERLDMLCGRFFIGVVSENGK